MQNKLTDLNNHLFLALERLNDEELNPEDTKKEIERARAVAALSTQIVSNAALQLRAVELQLEYGEKDLGLGGLIGIEKK